MTYDCEIDKCMNKTNGFLCEVHEEQALDETNRIIVCENCNKILGIEDRKEEKTLRKLPRYRFVKDCMRCRSLQIDSKIQ